VGRPYLRGTVLVHYSAHLKRWMQGTYQLLSSGAVPLKAPPSDAELVRQEVVLEPSDGKFLFSVFPWWKKEKDEKKGADRVAFDNINEKLSVSRSSDNPTGTSYRYSVLTDAFRSGWQIRATPFLHDPYRLYADGMSRRLHDYLTDMNYDTSSDQGREFLDLMRFPQLRQLVNRVIEAAPAVDPANHLQVAKALEDHLRTSGEYRYSLDFRNLKRDPALDPIEDFLVNHRTGHCEYFAGALALMLRSRNIPSRIVVGFAGGEFNPMGGFYQVRAKDAHAWVEAYIEPAHFEKDMLLPAHAEQTGVWYRLDPTPAVSEEDTEIAGTSPFMHKVDQFLDYFRFVWSDYIVGLDEERQQQAVFGNLPDQQSDALGGSHVRGWLDQAARTLGLASSDDAGKLRIRWPTVIVVLVGLVLLSYGARRLLRPTDKTKPKSVLRRWISRVVDLIAPAVFRPSHGKAHKRHHAEMYLEFYARLTRLVAPLGLIRQEGQTQQEFANKIRDQLLQLQQADSIASLPGKIVQVFYRVRFGGASLDTVEQENIEQDLSKLEQALSTNHD
jgi:transglutaminase-like putative cysteine protease